MSFNIITGGGINRISIVFYFGVGLRAINITKDIQPSRARFRAGAESPKAVTVKGFIIQKHIRAEQRIVIGDPAVD